MTEELHKSKDHNVPSPAYVLLYIDRQYVPKHIAVMASSFGVILSRSNLPLRSNCPGTYKMAQTERSASLDLLQTSLDK